MDDLELQIAERTRGNPDFPRLIEEAKVGNAIARINRFVEAYEKAGKSGPWIADSDYQFTAVFSDEDLAVFASEMKEIGAGLKTGQATVGDYWDSILAWQATSEVWADPELLARLSDPQMAGPEIERPESRDRPGGD